MVGCAAVLKLLSEYCTAWCPHFLRVSEKPGREVLSLLISTWFDSVFINMVLLGNRFFELK